MKAVTNSHEETSVIDARANNLAVSVKAKKLS